MPRFVAASFVLAFSIASAGCARSHYFGVVGDGGVPVESDEAVRCEEAQDSHVGSLCDGSLGECETRRGGCCTVHLSCVDGAIIESGTTCADVCWRGCELDGTVGGAAAHDACEGAFFCATFGECCTRTAECSDGEIVIDEACAEGC